MVESSFKRRIQHLHAHFTSAVHQREDEYTIAGSGTFSQAQRQEYAEKGFVVVKGLLSQAEVDKYVARFRELSGDASQIPSTTTVMRDIALARKEKDIKLNESSITKLQDFYDDPVLFSYASIPKILDIVASISGDEILSIHTMLINKPPDLGLGTSRHPAHQDLHYFPYRPANRIVASWTALELIDRSNGCLFVLPGSHKRLRLQPHDYDYSGTSGAANKLYHGVDESLFNENDLVHLIMEPGDTVFFHPLLLHGSGINTSNRYRKAISSHYASRQCHIIDVAGTSQQSIADEINELARKKFGKFLAPGSDLSEIHVDFKDLWESKSKLVRPSSP